ncbi:MAG: hypothetical protein WAN48_11310 [Actinomycetes bacterium]
MRIAAIIAGLVIVLAMTSSVLRTLVVPRRMRSKISEATFLATWWPLRSVAHRTDSYLARDRILAWAGPLSIVITLVVWLLGYLVGYSLMLFGLESTLSPATAAREAGSSLLTLGFASTDRGQLTAVDFVAAATGPLVIGLLIGYLPTLYGAYNRRETDVTMLEARAGEPNWGPEILSRHAAVGAVANMEDLFAAWERWAADISESHTNYPVLIHIRSSQPMRHWLVGMVAVMDAAAMQLALAPDLPQGRARISLRQGFVALRDISQVEGIPFDPDPSPDAEIDLAYGEFESAVAAVVERGFPATRSAAEAWPHFRGWRVNYEAIAYALARRLDAPPALWTGTRYGDLPAVPPVRPVNREPGGRTGPPSVPGVNE